MRHAPASRQTRDRLLTADDIAALTQATERVHANLSDLLRLIFASSARNPAQMSARLKIDRSTGYRVWRATQLSASAWDDIIRVLPGPAGLRRFADACERSAGRAGIPKGSSHSLLIAATQLDEQVRSRFGSHTRLKSLLDLAPLAGASVKHAVGSHAARRAAFETNVTWNRASLDLTTAVVLVMPSDRPGFLVEVAMLVADCGYRAEPGGRPLIVQVGSAKLGPDTAEHDEGLEVRGADGNVLAGRSDNCIVPQFSTNPLPSVIRIPAPERQVASLCIDPANIRHLKDGLDLAVAFRLDPIADSEEQARAPFKGFVKTIGLPSRRMIVDVYMHKSFARRCVPEASAHASGSSLLTSGPDATWASRLHEYPELRILPEDISASDDPDWPACSQATAYLLDHCKVNRPEYVAHRMSVAYPIWSAAYKLGFSYV